MVYVLLCVEVNFTHLCLFDRAKAGETFLSLLIVYDGLAVMAIVYHVVRQAKGMNVVPILQLIQRDGLLYFSVMFSSNLVWLMMALYARVSIVR